MKATYYRIITNDNHSIINEDIIRNNKDTICPEQEKDEYTTKKYDLPYEYEAHHFKGINCKIELFTIEIEFKNLLKFFK